jgi:methionyl-tRNA formyltransferase
MLTDRGMDTGPILTQETLPIERTATTASLTPTLAAIGAALLLRTIPGWIAGSIEARAQDETSATLSRQFAKADGALDWTRSALDLERQVRALNPWPRAFTFVNGKRLTVLLAQAIDGADPLPPGTVSSGPGRTLQVATGDGTLRLDQVQPEGGREVGGPQFLGNHPALLDARLG